MKFEVIGWMSYSDVERYPLHRGDGGSVTRAVVKAIREGGYKFGGNTQEDASSGLPVLNDGTMASYSWRGWGGVMAKAHELPDPNGFAYMAYYMDHPDLETGALPEIVLPPRGVDRSRIRKRKDLVEEFELPLSPAAFGAVLSGKKRAEIGLGNEQLWLICKDDVIRFTCEGRSLRVKVTRVEDILFPEKLLGNAEGLLPSDRKDAAHYKLLAKKALSEGETAEQLYARLAAEYPKDEQPYRHAYAAISFKKIESET